MPYRWNGTGIVWVPDYEVDPSTIGDPERRNEYEYLPGFYTVPIDDLPNELLDEIMRHLSAHPGAMVWSYQRPSNHDVLYLASYVNSRWRDAAQRALWAKLDFGGARHQPDFVQRWLGLPESQRQKFVARELVVDQREGLSLVLAGLSSVPTLRTLVLDGVDPVQWNLITHPLLAALDSLTLEYAPDPVDDLDEPWDPTIPYPTIPFSLRKFAVGHNFHNPLSTPLLAAIFTASSHSLLTLSLFHSPRKSRPASDLSMDPIVDLFPLIAPSLIRLEFDSCEPPPALLPHLSLASNLKHLLLRLEFDTIPTTRRTTEFLQALNPNVRIRHLELRSMDDKADPNGAHGLDSIADAVYPYRSIDVLSKVEKIEVLHQSPEKVGLFYEAHRLVIGVNQAANFWCDKREIKLLDHVGKPFIRIDPPEPPRPPPPTEGQRHNQFIVQILVPDLEIDTMYLSMTDVAWIVKGHYFDKTLPGRITNAVTLGALQVAKWWYFD